MSSNLEIPKDLDLSEPGRQILREVRRVNEDESDLVTLVVSLGSTLGSATEAVRVGRLDVNEYTYVKRGLTDDMIRIHKLILARFSGAQQRFSALLDHDRSDS